MALRCFSLILLLTGSLSAQAAEVSNLRVWTDPEKTRAVLDLSKPAEYQLFTLQSPHRVVIDLESTSLKDSFEPDSVQSGVISAIRYGKPSSGTLRIVLDLNDSAQMKSFILSPTGQYGHRLVVDLTAGTGKQSPTVKYVADVQKPNRDVIIAIDAGHGGEDPGASGPKRTREKNVVLQIARLLKKQIDAEPGIDLEYAELRDARDLGPITSSIKAPVVALIAATVATFEAERERALRMSGTGNGTNRRSLWQDAGRLQNFGNRLNT